MIARKTSRGSACVRRGQRLLASPPPPSCAKLQNLPEEQDLRRVMLASADLATTANENQTPEPKSCRCLQKRKRKRKSIIFLVNKSLARSSLASNPATTVTLLWLICTLLLVLPSHIQSAQGARSDLITGQRDYQARPKEHLGGDRSPAQVSTTTLEQRHRRNSDNSEEEESATPNETRENGSKNFHLVQRTREPNVNSLQGVDLDNKHHSSPTSEALSLAYGSRASSGNQQQQQQQATGTKLQIVRLFAPESVQNGTNVTIDCMFKYDKKLDQRLTIKWFFNDEVEPIYQWIPELNKRVYSDKYERFIDKHYEVSEDVDFMLEAYKKLLLPALNNSNKSGGSYESSSSVESNSILGTYEHLATSASTPAAEVQDNENYGDASSFSNEEDNQRNSIANRRLLATRLNRLAKLGSNHSKQLLATLRSVLAMDDAREEQVSASQGSVSNFSKFRALRLIRPSVEMAGRYTCSVSSLDSEDLRSTRLIVYEPPKTFAFTVSKTSGQMYNLTCHAGPTYPRPALALYRYRAGQLETSAQQAGSQQKQRQQEQQQQQLKDLGRGRAGEPRLRLAAATLKQESLANTQTQLKVSAGSKWRAATSGGGGDAKSDSQDLKLVGASKELHLDDELMLGHSGEQLASSESVAIDIDLDANELQRAGATHLADGADGAGGDAPAAMLLPYEISAWALVDESSLSSNLVTQFECVLKIEGTSYEQRQSLALQKGWHVNSSASLMARTTLVGLMSVLASLLCLTVALVSAILVFKLLRRHANKSTRVHQRQVNMRARDDDSSSNDGCGSRRARLAGSGAAAASSSSSTGSSTSSSPSESSNTTTSGAFVLGNGGLTTNTMKTHEHEIANQTERPDAPARKSQSQASDMTRPSGALSPQPTQRTHHAVPQTSSIYQQQPQSQMSFNAAEFSVNQLQQQQQQQQQQRRRQMQATAVDQSDGIYRVPEQRSSFGTRYVIGGGGGGGGGNPLALANSQVWSSSANMATATAATVAHCTGSEQDEQDNLDSYNTNASFNQSQQQQQQRTAAASYYQGRGVLASHLSAVGQQRPQQPATISVNGKQLYC